MTLSASVAGGAPEVVLLGSARLRGILRGDDSGLAYLLVAITGVAACVCVGFWIEKRTHLSNVIIMSSLNVCVYDMNTNGNNYLKSKL